MARFIVAQVQCLCGKWVNIRFKQAFNGETMSIRCWGQGCSRSIVFNGSNGYVENQKRPTTITSNEVRKG